MSVKIRLARRGRKKRPFYQIVVADSRSPRDGKFIENLGSYNPMTKPATIVLDRDRAFEWLMKGAQPTDTARAMLKLKGVMYRKHLMRGVDKGALTEEKAMELYNARVEEKEASLAARFAESKAELAAFHKMVNGTPTKVAEVVEDSKEELAEFNAAGEDAPATAGQEEE